MFEEFSYEDCSLNFNIEIIEKLEFKGKEEKSI